MGGTNQDDRITLEDIRSNILAIEEFYTDTGLNMQREWAPKSERD